MSDLSQIATWREIHAQPSIWRDWGARLPVPALRDWIAAQDVSEIWLCGAGSSAYIGEIIAAALIGTTPRIQAVATTDIVARPHAYLRGQRRLVISFGRSGNSSESIGLLDALEVLAPDWPRLNITCNAHSVLARRGKAVILPETCHDAGFAMTASFSTMLLTALALLDGGDGARMAALADDLMGIFPHITAPRPDRVVFVGAGALTYAAREAALKVMELSAGQIPALWDSSLGFRHGPKSFVRPGTAIFVFPSSDAQARAYDNDLIAELRAQFPHNPITVPDLPRLWPDGWAAPLFVAMAQILAVRWSHDLGLNVDDPFAGQGTLTRVVAGVRLHPVAR